MLVIRGCMFLLSLEATSQLCCVSLNVGQATYKGLELTASSVRSYLASASGSSSCPALI
jgi:hypothetical protein